MRASDVATLLAFTVLATAFTLIVPVFEAPDEPDHLAHINFVASRGELTNQFDPDRFVIAEGNQPPLYYVAAAILVRAFGPFDHSVSVHSTRNPEHLWNGGPTFSTPLFRHPVTFRSAADRRIFYLLRLFTVALGAANLAALLRLSRRLARGPQQAWTAGWLVATLPQYLFHCGVLGNDVLAALLATLTIEAAFAALDEPTRWRHYSRMGLALGLGLISKKTCLTLLPGLAILLTVILFRQPRERRTTWIWKGPLPALGIALVVAGWFFARNQRLYGDLLGTKMERITLAFAATPRPLVSDYFRYDFPKGLTQTSFGRFGWLNISFPWPVYVLENLVLGGCALGLLAGWRTLPGSQRARLAMAAVFPLAALAGIIHFNLTFTQPQGRYLLPAIGPIAVLLVEGASWWLRRRPSWTSTRWVAVFWVVVTIAMDLLALQRISRTCPGAGREVLGM